ncbi:hypothetical protein BDV93DRAFT_582093 [Ceratobasidium sp. AG-I]|nr:hypothetical protein BDV93DRAFT_582093 [Ceratobasidium sp. AG-I]
MPKRGTALTVLRRSCGCCDEGDDDDDRMIDGPLDQRACLGQALQPLPCAADSRRLPYVVFLTSILLKDTWLLVYRGLPFDGAGSVAAAGCSNFSSFDTATTGFLGAKIRFDLKFGVVLAPTLVAPEESNFRVGSRRVSHACVLFTAATDARRPPGTLALHHTRSVVENTPSLTSAPAFPNCPNLKARAHMRTCTETYGKHARLGKVATMPNE